MKTIAQLTALLSLVLMMNSCAPDNFARQRYTNFGHAKKLHLKLKPQAEFKDQSLKEELQPVTAVSIPQNTSVLTDSIKDEKHTDVNRELLLMNEDHNAKTTLNRVEMVSRRTIAKAKRLHFTKKVERVTRKESNQKTEIVRTTDREDLNTQSRIFSLLAYYSFIPFIAFFIAIILTSGMIIFILLTAVFLLVTLVFITLAVIKGKQYKRECETAGIERSKREINRYKFNMILFILVSLMSGPLSLLALLLVGLA